MITTGIREFTDHDWMGFAGATPFKCGGAPIIDDSGDELIFVAGGEVVEVYKPGINGNDCWSLFVAFPTQAAARLFVSYLPGTIDELAELGFEQILWNGDAD